MQCGVLVAENTQRPSYMNMYIAELHSTIRPRESTPIFFFRMQAFGTPLNPFFRLQIYKSHFYNAWWRDLSGPKSLHLYYLTLANKEFHIKFKLSVWKSGKMGHPAILCWCAILQGYIFKSHLSVGSKVSVKLASAAQLAEECWLQRSILL